MEEEILYLNGTILVKKKNINKYYHVCICDRRNDKQQALLYTAQNLRLNRQWQILKNIKRYLQAVSQKRQTALAKLELPRFIETAFVHSWQATPRFRKQSSAHMLIFGLNCSGTVL